MSDLIAVPAVSERRAATALAALQWLQAEYRPDPEAPGARPAPAEQDGRLGRRLRRAGRRLGRGPALVLAGALAGAAAGLLGGVAASAAGGLTPVAPLLGGLLGAAVGAFLGPLLAGRPPRPPEDESRVTWLVSYLTIDESEPVPGRLRGTFVKVTLPREAEGRLRSILEHAAAPVGR